MNYAPRGASLILVLAALALVSFLALAILTFIRSEDRSARTSADLVELQSLTELPEKLIIAQMRQATQELGMTDTWTSQPGMIRRFDNTPSATGTALPRPTELYKLYSSPQMTAAGDLDLTTESDALVKWDSQPAQFTDLNEPIRMLPLRKQGNTAPNQTPAVIFPILDKRAQQEVDGFELIPLPGSTGVVDNIQDVDSPHPLPMPVSWLYVLRDGTIAPPGNASGKVVGVAGATKDNPIVGRVAFWTDDESCKLNINTATEPSPWQAPLTRSEGDVANARAIPAKNEFYRMSGHPAFTSLAPVLRKLGSPSPTPTDPIREPQDATVNGTSWWKHLAEWHELMPRTFTERSADYGTSGGASAARDEVTIKKSRLFTNVDELFFKPGLNSENGRPIWQTITDGPQITQENIRKAEFFLTTHNRAPELNPLNRPKISLWPVPEAENERSEIDKQFVNVSSLGSKNAGTRAYYLQRASNMASDGTPGSSQDPDAEMGIARNAQLFGSMQVWTEMPIPGFGGQFAGSKGKYSDDSRDQLLISMFDMVRWGVNPATPYNDRSKTPFKQAEEYSFLTSGDTSHPSAWSAVPMHMSNLFPSHKGYGRFPTLTEVSLVFMATDAKRVPDPKKIEVVDTNPKDHYGDETLELQVFVVIEPFMVAPGVPAVSPHYHYSIEGLEHLTINGQNAGFPKDAVSEVAYTGTVPQGSGSRYGGGSSPYGGFVAQFLTPSGGIRQPGQGEDEESRRFKFHFFGGQTIKLKPGEGLQDQRLHIAGLGRTTITLFNGTTPFGQNNRIVQQIYIGMDELNDAHNPPPPPVPVPLVHEAYQGGVLGTPPTQQLVERFLPLNSPHEGPQMLNLIHEGDVTRSWEPVAPPAMGDARLIAATPIVPPTVFKMYPTSARRGDSLRDGAHMIDGQVGTEIDANSGNIFPMPTTSTAGPLVIRPQDSGFNALMHDKQSVPATIRPQVVTTTGQSPLTAAAINADGRAGDFDNGPGLIEDGPYINAPGFNNGANESKVASNSNYSGWFDRGGLFEEEDGVTFSPWRNVSSGFLFGSLPTAVFGMRPDTNSPIDPAPRPWQTLLLCPNPPSRETAANAEPQWLAGTNSNLPKDHFGFVNPRDHLWLEYYWLPNIKPEGLCEGYATEGKVNMNYEMMPFFNWIKRRTALYGAMQGVRITGIPSTAASTDTSANYKNPNQASPLSFRYAVDAEKTMQGFEQRFATHDVFRSASEICDLFLVPKEIKGHTYSSGSVGPPAIPNDYKGMMNWWEGPVKTDPNDGLEATGDNARESPYAQLYPRLCTKSNVYTVHWRVQVLRKSRSTAANLWDKDKDHVNAEQRGQTMLERYLPPNADVPVDYGASANVQEALDDYYAYRIVNRRIFAP